MQFKNPQNTKEYYWTNHVIFKMRCYGLSVQKVLGVIKRPERKEEGIVKNTIAVMRPVNPKIQKSKKIWKQEVWVMYQKKVKSQPCLSAGRNSTLPTRLDSAKRAGRQEVKSEFESYKLPTTSYQLKIISAWRYPGVSPQKNPIPSDILAEIEGVI